MLTTLYILLYAYYILLILFVSIIILINIINSSILQQIISCFSGKYIIINIIFSTVAIIHMSKSMYVSYILYYVSYFFILVHYTYINNTSFRHSYNSPISPQYVTYALDIFFISLLVVDKYAEPACIANGQVSWICFHATLFYYTCCRIACYTSHTSSMTCPGVCCVISIFLSFTLVPIYSVLF